MSEYNSAVPLREERGLAFAKGLLAAEQLNLEISLVFDQSFVVKQPATTREMSAVFDDVNLTLHVSDATSGSLFGKNAKKQLADSFLAAWRSQPELSPDEQARLLERLSDVRAKSA